MPVYAHYAHLPFANEPLKTIYVTLRLLTTLVLVPYWALKYALLPRRCRPRPSWTILQIIHINFIRRIYKITEVAGVTWGTHEPQDPPEERSLRYTRFQWIDPLPGDLRTGIVNGDGVPFLRVGAYIYPKGVPITLQHMRGEAATASTTRENLVVGLFMHGGGYCHMSAHESSRTSRIPKRLMEDQFCDEIYSVEYRLLQHASFPAAIQDVAAVYAHVTRTYQSFQRKIILVGDSSGGNLVLALARWIRDEGRLPMPHALLLLSPSCDPSHALPETLSSYMPRPNGHTDYLTDTPEPRALLQRTFLGFHRRPLPEEMKKYFDIVHSEYVSPCSPIVLKRWGHDVDNAGTFHDRFEQTGDVARGTSDTQSVEADLGLDNTQGSQGSTTLFYGFPKTLVVVGDAERLTREISSLIQAMKSDGVDIDAIWIPDAVHDVLTMSEWTWDRKMVNQCWEKIGKWITSVIRSGNI